MNTSLKKLVQDTFEKNIYNRYPYGVSKAEAKKFLQEEHGIEVTEDQLDFCIYGYDWYNPSIHLDPKIQNLRQAIDTSPLLDALLDLPETELEMIWFVRREASYNTNKKELNAYGYRVKRYQSVATASQEPLLDSNQLVIPLPGFENGDGLVVTFKNEQEKLLWMKENPDGYCRENA